MKEANSQRRASATSSTATLKQGISRSSLNAATPPTAAILNSQNVFRKVMSTMSFGKEDDEDDYVAPSLIAASRRASLKASDGATRRQSLKAGLNILDSFNAPKLGVIVSSESHDNVSSSQNLAVSSMLKPLNRGSFAALSRGSRGSLAAMNRTLSGSMNVKEASQPAEKVPEKARLTGDQREEIKVWDLSNLAGIL
jgi:hypothetical protein